MLHGYQYIPPLFKREYFLMQKDLLISDLKLTTPLVLQKKQCINWDYSLL